MSDIAEMKILKNARHASEFAISVWKQGRAKGLSDKTMGAAFLAAAAKIDHELGVDRSEFLERCGFMWDTFESDEEDLQA